MSGKCDMRVKNSNYVYMYVSYHFGTAICLGFRSYTQGKLQRSLLLCIKLCHVVIQAAQYGFQSL